MNLLIFATCKPFIGDDAWRQEQAIRSWKNIKSDKYNIKIVLIGKDDGVKEICEKYNLIHYHDVKTLQGVPYVWDLFNIVLGLSESKNDKFIWTNADMIYYDEMIENLLIAEKSFEKEPFSLYLKVHHPQNKYQ